MKPTPLKLARAWYFARDLETGQELTSNGATWTEAKAAGQRCARDTGHKVALFRLEHIVVDEASTN